MLKELGIEGNKVPSNIRNEKSLRMSFNLRQKCDLVRGFDPLVSITDLASSGVKPTLGSKAPPSGTLLPEMEKKSSGFFISDNGKRHCLPDFLTYFLIFFPQQQIIDLDEKNQLLKANIWLNYHWVDVNLSWNEVSKLTSNKTLYYKKFCLATE